MEITVVSRAHPKTKSVRVTIPATIADQLGLKVGDKVGWKIVPHEDKLAVKIMPIN